MSRVLLRRLAAIVMVSLAIVLFCSLGLRMMRQPLTAQGSSTMSLLRLAFRDSYTYLRALFGGNLGTVWRASGRSRTAVSVASLAADTYVKSMGLLAAALLFAAVLGTGLGALSAYWEGSPVAIGLLASSVLGISMPTFFTALFLQVVEIKWYQRTGIRLVPVGGFGWDSHIILPAMVLATRPLAQLARITSVSMSEAAGQDYVQTARAKGLPASQVWGGHILPNSIVPVLTALGISLRFSLGSLPVVEYFFGWPGMGATLLEAVRLRQGNLVITLALALGITFMLVNLVLELAYRVFDPRLRDLV